MAYYSLMEEASIEPLTKHVPPFSQGKIMHSSMSLVQRSPVQPVAQVQVNVLNMSCTQEERSRGIYGSSGEKAARRVGSARTTQVAPFWQKWF